jgi:hypothetical protein
MERKETTVSNNHRILAFTGRIHSGKSTAARYAVSCLLEYMKAGIILSFADALKLEAYASNWSGAKDEAGRTLLQSLGQARREEDPDYWVKLMRHVIALQWSKNPDQTIIIDDLRYDNEAELVATLGGVIFLVIGDHGGSKGISNHPSEAGISPHYVSEVIFNDGSLEQLYPVICHLLKRFKYVK